MLGKRIKKLERGLALREAHELRSMPDDELNAEVRVAIEYLEAKGDLDPEMRVNIEKVREMMKEKETGAMGVAGR